MNKDDIINLYDSCWQEDEYFLHNTDFKLDLFADTLMDIVADEKKQLLLEFYDFVLKKRFSKCPAHSSYDLTFPQLRYATLMETDLKNDIEEFIEECEK